MNPSDSNRLRTPPRERFAEDSLNFDLERAFEELANESHEAVNGHRQITLFKGGAFTVVAFQFEREGFLPRHHTDGIVMFHVLDGRLNIQTDSGRHALGEHGLLVLQPFVHFSLHASEPSRVVMTVHLVDGQARTE